MNLFQAIIVVALAGNIALGLFILLSNPKRAVNRAFFYIVGLMTLWLGAMFMGARATDERTSWFFVCLTSAFAGLLPHGAMVLQATIINPRITLLHILRKLRGWLVAGAAATALCFSPVFVLSSQPVPGKMIQATQYGWGFPVYLAYLAGAISLMTLGFRRAAQSRIGVQKTEIHFLQMGCVFSLATGLALAAIAAGVGNLDISLFVPLAALVFDGFVGYGIATRRILSASAVLQRVISYSLMTAYLAVLYVGSVWIWHRLFGWVLADPADLAHLLAALGVAFSVVPAHGWMQSVSHRLFAPADLLDGNSLLTRAGAMFQEVATEANLMENFNDLVSRVFGAPDVLLLRPGADAAFVQAHPEPAGAGPVCLAPDSAIVQLLQRDREAFTVETLERMRASPLVAAARAEMKAVGVALAIGSFARNELKAVLLLAPRKSGRIYDLRDQRVLRMLCDQLAVALENANLYTAVQNGKIYNDILLDSLTSGIVAVDAARIVTVFNQCAQGLTGLTESALVGRPMQALPPVLAEALETILAGQSGFRDRDLVIRRGEESIPVRVSGSRFHGHTGASLGALLVINDMTLLKTMEEQIRRTDRLSSIGTLSAGMAHEIKNPLVTIKTFAQLLPQQYADSEFRNTFFDLVGQEVQRIDTIVNRLLNFARPTLPTLKPAALHGILENALRLVEQQLFQKEITLVRHLDAETDLIAADAEQLNQTFINLFLNAIQSMGKGGTLTVSTAVVPRGHEAPTVPGLPDGDCIQVDVADTGCGIAAENLARIFDPFYTTKETGVGLGLSVSHGIVREHGGTIHADSEPGQGSVFHVRLPLRRRAGGSAG